MTPQEVEKYQTEVGGALLLIHLPALLHEAMFSKVKSSVQYPKYAFCTVFLYQQMQLQKFMQKNYNTLVELAKAVASFDAIHLMYTVSECIIYDMMAYL